MDRKYFDKTIYKKMIEDFVIISVLVIILGLTTLPINQIHILLYCMITMYPALHIQSYNYPILSNDELIRKHSFFHIKLRSYNISDIEKITVKVVRFGIIKLHFPGIYVHIKGKSRPRVWGLDGMSKDSIKPFVEELRAKGIEVECEPYTLDNGKTMYL